MEEEPICEFPKLKKALIEKGYKIGKAIPWRKIDSEEVDLSEGKLDIRDDGIFLTDDDGVKRQVFLYKRRYKLMEYGKPRFHVCLCETIQKFLSDRKDIPEYRRANTRTVKVLNWDNNDEEEEVSDLPLCKNCAKIMYNNKFMNSSEFAEILQNAASEDVSSNARVDIHGYTKDWQLISSNYRKKKGYRCEKCGIKVTSLESEFMHVHHINGKKTDNKDSNLQCLCIKCHSEIDATHILNFSTKGQQLLIKLFLEKYGNRTD